MPLYSKEGFETSNAQAAGAVASPCSNLISTAVNAESFLSPSTNMRAPWLARAAPAESFASTEMSGKWLIYREPNAIDSTWIQVLSMVSSGKLLYAKVSTRQGIVLGHSKHVICVYTRNWRARTEVMRVRDVLRSAGFTERLRYKRDLDTARGVERFTYEA